MSFYNLRIEVQGNLFSKLQNGISFASQERELEESIDAHKQEQGVIELENNIQVEEIDDLKKQLAQATDDYKKIEKESMYIDYI